MQFNSQMHFSLTRVAPSSVRLRDMVNPKYKVRASSSSSNRDGCIETSNRRRDIHSRVEMRVVRSMHARTRETNVFVSFSFAQWTPEEEDALRDGVAKCVDRSV